MSKDAAKRNRERRQAWVQAQKTAPSDLRYVLHVIWRIFLTAVPVSLLILWLVAATVRLVVQDRLPSIWAYFYYGTPPTVLTLLALGAAMWWFLRRQRRLALAPAGLAALSLGWTMVTMCHYQPARTVSGTPRRAVFWNIARGVGGWDRIAGAIERRDADIVGLVESLSSGPSHNGLTREAHAAARQAKAAARAQYWRERLPGYEAIVTRQGLTVLTRGQIVADEMVMLGGDNYTAFGYCLHAEIDLDGERVHVGVVDVLHKVRQPRSLQIGRLVELVERIGDEPLVLGGDFNTPVDSVYLAPLRLRSRNAFETVGRGYMATWPIPLPLVAIDQAWLSDRVEPGHAWHGWTVVSDHRPVIVEFGVAPEKP